MSVVGGVRRRCVWEGAPVLRLGSPAHDELDRLLAEASGHEVTYDHVGSTLGPTDRRVRREERAGGTGEEGFAAGIAAIRRWVAHDGIGARVHPAGTPIEVGRTLLVVLPVGPACLVVPNRIVAVVDEPRRFGFAYGSLPGHDERGEESFEVELGDDGRVVARVSVDAAPGTRLTTVVAPLTLTLQRLAVRRYADTLAAATR